MAYERLCNFCGQGERGEKIFHGTVECKLEGITIAGRNVELAVPQPVTLDICKDCAETLGIDSEMEE